MRRISRKAATTCAFSMVMIFTIVVSALAGTAYSNYSEFTCGSYGYRNRATVITDASGAKAATHVYAYPSATRAAGWYGYLARLYNDANTLVKQDGYHYNSVSCTGFWGETGYYTVRGNYYSYGISKSWTGSEYHGHATWKSPLQTY